MDKLNQSTKLISTTKKIFTESNDVKINPEMYIQITGEDKINVRSFFSKMSAFQYWSSDIVADKSHFFL